ncbi:uncharacterized protein BDZ99DRAFT_495658 [Mytilinidion resinicola]|uniref:Uncharacterized protein n=1 Tax=Mytilinidion resinicola TaxID=574789 RepID=A0A6A6Z1J5_9PEZI|nr:uncharacterized protein BDZ99DRAFT_495658 [Mytilinidion resinicola]KAF2814107.1 hypothetical protein BDZ99DRAFT_495658 [Mytilinidion resinicola]
MVTTARAKSNRHHSGLSSFSTSTVFTAHFIARAPLQDPNRETYRRRHSDGALPLIEPGTDSRTIRLRCLIRSFRTDPTEGAPQQNFDLRLSTGSLAGWSDDWALMYEPPRTK